MIHRNNIFLKLLTNSSESDHRFNEVQKSIIDYLSTDDDAIFSTTREPILLLIAKLIFRSNLNLKVIFSFLSTD